MSGLSAAARTAIAAVAAWQEQYGDGIHLYRERHEALASYALVCTSLPADVCDAYMAAYPLVTGRRWTPAGVDVDERCSCPKSMGRRQVAYEAKNITEEDR